MKKTAIPACIATAALTLGALLAPVAAPAVDEKMDHESYTGFEIADPVALPAKESHPSLWFTRDAIPALRAKRHADADAARFWEALVGVKHLTMPIPAVPSIDDEKTPIHQFYGDLSLIAATNAFMSLMTEDPVAAKNYESRAIECMMRSYEGPIYDIDPKESSTPVDEIYRGTWLQNYGAAYDWLHDKLTPEQDAEIRARFAKECQYLYENLDRLAPNPHNHLSKPAWGLGSMALVMSEHPDAKAWLEKCIEASNRNTRFYYSADGISREGSHYYIFSFVNFFPFLYHYRNVAGVDAFDDFQPAFEWPLAIRNGRGWMPNIEDSYIRPYPSFLVASAYKDRPTSLHSRAPLGELLQWNFRNTDFTPFDKALERDGFNYTGASWDYAFELLDYICYDPSIPATKPEGSPTVFLPSGQTAFRSDWAFASRHSRHLLFQGVAECDNHAHFDHLSFIFEAENQMMASDAGYSRKSYGESIRKEWYLTPEAHNIVLFDGLPPRDPAESVTPPSLCRIDTSFFDYEEKQAPWTETASLKRAIAFPGEEYFVVADYVVAEEPGEVEILFHGGRSSLEREDRRCLWTYEADDYGSAAKLDSVFVGDGIEMTEKSGEVTYIKGDYAEFPYVSAKTTTDVGVFLQIHVPLAPDRERPVIHETTTGGGHLIYVTMDNDVTDTIAVANGRGPWRSEQVRSDARFVWIRDDGSGVYQCAARDATFLDLGNGNAIRFPTPTSFAARLSGGNILEVSVAGEGVFVTSSRLD